MTETDVATVPAPTVSLPCPLPPPYEGEPEALSAYRKEPRADRLFLKIRRQFRDNEDWRALATLLVLHAAHIDRPKKAAELCIQAYELWLERVKDKREAAHALARAVILAPDNVRSFERLRKLYDGLGWQEAIVKLLTWKIDAAQYLDPTAVPRLQLNLAELLEHRFGNVAAAVKHYREAVANDPNLSDASEHLIRIHLDSGAWRGATALIEAELERLDAASNPDRVSLLHRRLARIDSHTLDNVASSARHLQAALKAQPENIEALRDFGDLYLSSGKATDEGLAKAADIFFKAAQLARHQGNPKRALRLLRRTLGLRPDHQDGSAALEQTLVDAEDWTSLDELYREWLSYVSGADAVPYLLRRAELLDQRLARTEEARQLYEEASRFQHPDGESWRALERIYETTLDFHALAALLEAKTERDPQGVSCDTLVRTALLYRDELGSDERAAFFFHRVLEREPFNDAAFEGYKEHWRRKHNWAHLRALILYQIDQAAAHDQPDNPLDVPEFAEEFVELANICERRLGDIDGALDAWGRLSGAYPSDPRPSQQIARIEKRARMWDNMVRVQEAELERTTDPGKRLDILKRLTQVYRDRQVNPDRAIELYNEILSHSPNDVQATRALTALYDRAGDFGRVADMLREQYDRSRSNTERISLLRRMAELYQHELGAPDEAIWACEQLLSHAPADRNALHRLQLLHEEQGTFEYVVDAVEREFKVASSGEDKSKLLRRMAQVAERELGDTDCAAETWGQLLQLQPSNLQIVDKMLGVYESAGRYEELGTLLEKTSASTKTPEIRQQDYLLRLGYLAESSLEDPDLARSAFERVLRLREDHRGALEALVRIYRKEKAWQPLSNILGTLQQLSETREDEFRIAWERAELLADRLDDPAAAVDVLLSLPEDLRTTHQEVSETLLELYERAGKHQKVVRHAELLLLSAESPAKRRRLYNLISRTWLQHLDDQPAALSAYQRFIDEFPEDLDGLWTLANLQEELKNYDATLETLQRRLDLAAAPDMKVTTLEHMARVAESGLGDVQRALGFLREAMIVDPTNEAISARIDSVARDHNLWTELLTLADLRFDQMGDLGDHPTQIEICLESSDVAADELHDAKLAFNWARRGYFTAFEMGLDTGECKARLEQLAEDHKLWESLLNVTEQEIGLAATANDKEADFDTIQRYLSAADIAERQLSDPERAVAYLQRAHALRPDDEELARQLERTAEQHGLWDAVVDLYQGRLQRAETNLGRLDAFVMIAKLQEERLGLPLAAMDWLRRAWRDFTDRDETLAQDILDTMAATAERTGLFAIHADHSLERARARFDGGDAEAGLAALIEAAEIYDDKLDDAMGAIRMLAQGIPHDDNGEQILPIVRGLAEALDEKNSHGKPGALAHLAVLQKLVARSGDPDMRIRLLEERALVREERLEDVSGAMAEWLRVHTLDTERPAPGDELRRLAAKFERWGTYLLFPGVRLQEARAPDAELEVLEEIASIYEEQLQKVEYAFRARLQAWRRKPFLPSREGELAPPHDTLWRLAGETGPYQTPPVPKDPLLEPSLGAPEEADMDHWRALGLSPDLLNKVPRPRDLETASQITDDDEAPEAATAEVANSEAEPPPSQVVGLDALADMAQPPNPHDLDDLEDFEEIEEIEEIEDLELMEEVEEIGTAEVVIGNLAPPPPPPGTVDEGLPEVPKLGGTLIPVRPRLASGWEELAANYADAIVGSKVERAAGCLVLARLWEEGAEQLERTFGQYEQALLLDPEEPQALEALQSLAHRHDAVDRLLEAYESLLAEAALPEHVVAQSLRLAELHEERENWDQAEQRYRGVLAVQPTHEVALQRLSRIYESQERWADYVNAYGELLDVQAPILDDEERIERSRRIVTLQEDELGKTSEAVEFLERLVREFSDREILHEDLIGLLIKHAQWQKAIDALRNASENLQDSAYEIGALVRIADIYEEQLQIPDRAIEAWNQVLEREPDHNHALEKLQGLYFATGRYEQLLPVLEQRLEEVGDDPEHRIPLLVAKARTLQEGLGDDARATETLEQLVTEAPDNDDVALGLSRLYRRSDRLAEGVDLLRERLGRLSSDADDRRIRLSEALARALHEDGHDAAAALAVVDETLERVPNTESFLRLRVELARSTQDMARLVDSLAALPDLDGILEAADLARTRTKDPPLAIRLYSRVLAEAKGAASEPESARRLAAAIEGLVKLRMDEGDVTGAMEFMDRQLAEMEGPTIRARLLGEIGRITFRATGDIEAARTRFQAALEEDPDYSPAKLGLGEILMEAGELQEAEAHLEAAVENLGLTRDQENLVEGLVLLARILERTDRSGEAYRRLNTALRHDSDNFEIRAAMVHNRHGAHRWRDVCTAVDQLDKRLDEGLDVPLRQRHLVSNMYVAAAEAEGKLKKPENILPRFRRALEVDSENRRALEGVIPICQEQGAIADAARYAAALAPQVEDAGDRARAFMEAAILFREAAETETGEDEPSLNQLRRDAIEAYRTGLGLAEASDEPRLDRRQLEQAYTAASEEHPSLALRALDRLLLRDDLDTNVRQELLLEGAQLARSLDHEDAPQRAETYARSAAEMDPPAAAAVVMLAELLEARGRSPEIETLIESFLSRTSGDAASPEELDARASLLGRLADLQSEQPDRAVATLERAAAISPAFLDLKQRKNLARLYEESDASAEKRLENHRELLELDPLHTPSLVALADCHCGQGDIERAHALYTVALLADPDEPNAREFLSLHEVTGSAAGEMELDSVIPGRPSDAGMAAALVSLWEGGSALLSGQLPHVDVPSEGRISPIGESVLAQAWGDVLRKLGQSKIALVKADAATIEEDEPPEEHESDLFRVRCLHPPVILASQDAQTSEDRAAIRFALARAAFLTRPEAVFVTGLARPALTRILSAALQAFHPRHARRKHHTRDETVRKLSQEFARKLPIRLARQLSNTFKERDTETFDSREWREWIHRGANRVGLVLGGDIEAALRVLSPETSGNGVPAAIRDRAELRDLVAFASSQEYTTARKSLGYDVRPASDETAEQLD